MAKFIEIKDGIFVNADEIEAIISINNTKNPDIVSKVYTHHNNYPSILPAQAILNMMTNIPKDKEDDTQEQMLNIMKQQSNFAG